MSDTCSLERFLESLGYRTLRRSMEWEECLIVGDGESWMGRGLSADEALTAAVAEAFPTKAAERALALALERFASVSEVEAREEEGLLSTEPEASAGVDSHLELEVSIRPMRAEPVEPDASAGLASLLELQESIQTMKSELATAAPHRQRLVVLGWLGQARHWQEISHDHPEVDEGVASIVRELRSLSETWWPGTIRAFQRHALPSTCGADLPRGMGGHLSSWEEVGEAALSALSLIEEEEAGARDEGGWADFRALAPPPRSPSLELARLRAEMEEAGGDVMGRQPKGEQAPDPSTLEGWAIRARWLRGAADPLVWGALMGRLRFLSQQSYRATSARALLDPAHLPPRPWATLTQRIEGEHEEKAELEQVLASVPARGGPRKNLVAWLERALPLTSHFQRAIAAACLPLRDEIETVRDDEIPDADRRIRRRLQKLKQSFERTEIETSPTPRGAAEVDDYEGEANEVSPDLLQETEGRTVLFVSNRTDSQLQQRLQERLRFQRVEWAEGSPLRISAAVDSILSGRYDLVLGATGFLRHSVDGNLSKACRAAGIPYIRVNRGRPLAVEMALAHGHPRKSA